MPEELAPSTDATEGIAETAPVADATETTEQHLSRSQLFDELMKDVPGSETQTPESDQGSSSDEPPDAEAGADAEGTEQVSEESTSDETAGEDEDDATPSEKDGMLDVRESRWKKSIHPGYKYSKSLVEALTGSKVESLDASMLPPLEDVKAWHKAFVDQQVFESDLANGSPQKVVERLGDKAATFAQNLMPHLAQNNPQAYNAAAGFVLKTFLDGLDSSANGMDPQSKAAIQNAVDVAEYHLTGGKWYRRMNQPQPQVGEDGQPIHNPGLEAEQQRLEQMRQEIARERQQFQAQQNQQLQAVASERSRAWSSDLNQGIAAQIDDTLKPLTDTLEPVYLDGAKQKMYGEVQESIRRNSNFPLFEQAFQRATATGDQGELDRARQTFKSMVNVAINSLRPAYLKGAQKNISAMNESRHEKLRQASSQRAPAPKNGGVRQAVPVELGKLPDRRSRFDALMKTFG